MTEHSPAVTLLTRQMEARQKIREHWRKDGGALLDAHQFAFSAVAQMADRFGGRRFEQQIGAMEGRMSLTAQFIQGVDTCETTISEGLYSQAAALLKQEMEIIEAVHEFEEGSRRDGRTPKLGKLKAFGRVYGHFNEFAHASQEKIAKSLVTLKVGELCGPSIVPLYDPHIAQLFYGLHTYFIFMCANQMNSLFLDLFGVGLNDVETKWLFLCLDILVREDVVKPHDPEAWNKLKLLVQK